MADGLREAPPPLTLGGTRTALAFDARIRASALRFTSESDPRPMSGLVVRSPVGAAPPRTPVVPRSQRSRAPSSTSPRHASIRFNRPHPQPYQLPDSPNGEHERIHTATDPAHPGAVRLWSLTMVHGSWRASGQSPAWRCFSRLRSTLANEDPPRGSRTPPSGVHEVFGLSFAGSRFISEQNQAARHSGPRMLGIPLTSLAGFRLSSSWTSPSSLSASRHDVGPYTRALHALCVR
ncbi:hypothetical protein GSI_07770 [Ganoderma sinense ZZ0214-1]|uniref:Uncharacterized protein n=1 Tax=Ganoderma sinense ZZ0214-1 TaxID=1077348 RepID=A0A2G8S961_9APHY|nr:hypothetical protein GSI_07665 [Ganoderma sinense ZZ0214-1]PIL30192.1 hypothetical protein GSI_07770 [Ganoderma sinense ZZ0214-1]